LIRVEINQVQLVNRAIAAADSEIQAGAKKEILSIGELVAGRIEVLSLTRIRNIGPVWWDMRVGQNPNLVYVVPRQRGTKVPARKRKQFAVLMLRKAFDPASAASRPEIKRRFDALLERVAGSFNSGG
jgi:hypothetical protein